MFVVFIIYYVKWFLGDLQTVGESNKLKTQSVYEELKPQFCEEEKIL